jgi:hypothetical protein
MHGPNKAETSPKPPFPFFHTRCKGKANSSAQKQATLIINLEANAAKGDMHVEGMHTHKLAPRGGIPHTARKKCEHRKRLQEGKCSQPKKLSHCALLNVCISFNNANMERVQAPQQIGTLECQSMKRQSPLGEPQQSLKLHVVHRMERGFAYKCLPQRALPTLPLMCYRAETAKNWMSTTLQMTQGQSSGRPNNQLVSRTTFRTNGKPPPSNMIITSREPTNPANGTRPNLQVDPVGSSFLSPHHPWQKNANPTKPTEGPATRLMCYRELFSKPMALGQSLGGGPDRRLFFITPPLARKMELHYAYRSCATEQRDNKPKTDQPCKWP